MKRAIKKFIKSTCSLALCTAMIFSNFSGFVLNQKPTNVQAANKNYELVSNVQDAAILHCWNWSYSTIEQHLELIAES